MPTPSGRSGWMERPPLRWAAGFLAAAVVVISLSGALSCSDGESALQPAEPVEVLDLVGSFPGAGLSQAFPGVAGGGSSPNPYVKPERRLLHVSFGWDVDYDLEAPPNAVLVSREAKILGSPVGRLEVVWTPNKGAERVLTRDISAEPDRRARFGNRGRESGRLSLRARAAGEVDGPRAGSRIFEPVVAAGFAVETPPTGDPTRGREARPNIVVYLIDALRADRLGCYGHRGGCSPNIDEFASSAIVFRRAQAQTSWTRSAVASMFTGLLPQQHQAVDKSDVLPDAATTIAELLAVAGYQTAAVISNGNVARYFGFAQGFTYFKHLEQVMIGNHVVRSDDVNRAIFSWLDTDRGSEPFFLYVHTVDPHLPYDPPEPYRRDFAGDVTDPAVGSVEMVNELAAHPEMVTPELVEQLSSLYDGEVAANDAAFGRLLAGLEDRGLDDNTVIMVVSDHGEEFFDHRGWTHGNTLFVEMLDVPLVIRIPGVAPRSIHQIVQHVDLFPTLLELAGVPPPAGVFGRSASPLWNDDQGVEWADRGLSHLDIRQRFGEAWVDPQWKLLIRRLLNGKMHTSLYDRRADPLEQHDLAGERPDVVEELRSRYRAEVDAAGEKLPAVEVDDDRESEIEAQLRALGYL